MGECSDLGESVRHLQQFKSPIRGTDARYGYFFYNQFDHVVGRCLELYGEYCEAELHLFRSLIKTDDVIWEIGANIGSQTVPISQIANKGTVYAFEPQLEVFKLLCANLSVNVCENVIPLWMAIGDKIGEILLPNVNYHQPANFGGISLIEGNSLSSQRVTLETIDNAKVLLPPNFIKIDVEGMELVVLKGGAATIIENRPLLYVENNGDKRFGEGTSESLIEYLWQLDYRLYWHVSYYYNVNNYFSNRDNIYGRKVACNMICVPKESTLFLDEEEIKDKSAFPFNW
jgi:FkbM family methyltransferase